MNALHPLLGSREADGSLSLKLVRVRLSLALLATFVLLVMVGTPLVYSATRPVTGSDVFVVTLVLVVLGLLQAGAMGVMARKILEPAEELDSARARLNELYDRARLDALHDALTGLGNHRAFQEELELQLEQVRLRRAAVALLLIDLDDLKAVNDERGHAAGDDLLTAMGRIVVAVIRRDDRAFRIGGDEFAVLMPHADAEAAFALARRLLATALEGGGDPYPVPPFSFSAGISAVPGPSRDERQLLRQADAALYWCKHHGRTAVEVFDPARHGVSGDPRSPAELSAAVAQVAAGRTLRPVYQPIFALDSGLPLGFEGLVRPDRNSGFRDAESLFAAAEATGRAVELDIACLEVVVGGAGPIREGQYISLNISPRTLETEQFSLGELVAILTRHGISPRQVVLELTERQAVEDLDRLRRSLAACRSVGIRVAVDDVGAGNAGLRLLSHVQFDVVKIDLSLVQGGVVRESSLAVLSALRDMAERWHATVVAEGVETSAQLEVVRGLGIPAAQGYLLGKPGPISSIAAVDVDLLIAQEGLERLTA